MEEAGCAPRSSVCPSVVETGLPGQSDASSCRRQACCLPMLMHVCIWNRDQKRAASPQMSPSICVAFVGSTYADHQARRRIPAPDDAGRADADIPIVGTGPGIGKTSHGRSPFEDRYGSHRIDAVLPRETHRGMMPTVADGPSRSARIQIARIECSSSCGLSASRAQTRGTDGGRAYEGDRS